MFRSTTARYEHPWRWCRLSPRTSTSPRSLRPAWRLPWCVAPRSWQTTTLCGTTTTCPRSAPLAADVLGCLAYTQASNASSIFSEFSGFQARQMLRCSETLLGGQEQHATVPCPCPSMKPASAAAGLLGAARPASPLRNTLGYLVASIVGFCMRSASHSLNHAFIVGCMCQGMCLHSIVPCLAI